MKTAQVSNHFLILSWDKIFKQYPHLQTNNVNSLDSLELNEVYEMFQQNGIDITEDVLR
jgi:hypothetical protein